MTSHQRTPKRRRPRGGGSCYKRHKPGCPQFGKDRPNCGCPWWIEYRGLDGRRYRESTETSSKQVAEGQLRSKVGDIGRGKPVTPDVGKLTFAEARDAMITDYTNSGQRSVSEAERRIARLAKFFGVNTRMVTITTTRMKQYIAWRQELGIVAPSGPREGQRVKEANPADINRDLSILRRMFNLAVEDERLVHVPKVPLLAEHGIRTGFFEVEQLEAVLPHLPESVRPVVEFGYITGWRLREITGLQWRNVDLQGGEIRLDHYTTKSGAPRTFPITTALRRIIDDRAAERDRLKKVGRIVADVFFRTTADDETEPIGSFKKSWKTATRKAGCPGRLFHDLRRTAIRNAVRSGIPERVAMDLCGHATRSVFDRYNVTGGSDLKDAGTKLDAHLGPRIAKAQ